MHFRCEDQVKDLGSITRSERAAVDPGQNAPVQVFITDVTGRNRA